MHEGILHNQLSPQCNWTLAFGDGLSRVIQHPSRDFAHRRHFDFKAHRVAAGGNLKRLAETLQQETAAAFQLQIFGHKKTGNLPEAASRIGGGVGAGF